MRITIARSGGFTGIPTEVTVDENDMQPDELNQLHAAIHETQFFVLPTRLPDPSQGADQFSYTITIEDEGGVHTVIASESALPAALDAVVHRLMRRARGR